MKTINLTKTFQTVPFNDANIVLLFDAKQELADTKITPGPGAVLHAMECVELFELQVGSNPFEYGISIEMTTPETKLQELTNRIKEALSQKKIPIIVTNDRTFTAQYCNDYLLALWGKLGRSEADESSLLSQCESVIAGVRSASSTAFHSVPSTASIITAQTILKQFNVFENILKEHTKPFHISIDLDVLSPATSLNSRSIEPGGLEWYDLMKIIELLLTKKTFYSLELTGCQTIRHQSPTSVLCAQIILTIASLAGEQMAQTQDAHQ